MIARYSRKNMTRIWTSENKYRHMLEVEKAVARAEAKRGIIPRKAARDIEAKGRFRVSRIEEIESVTKHDVIAFVQNVAEFVGQPSGAYVHFGLTSSDVLDTALSLTLREAGEELLKTLDQLAETLAKLTKKHVTTLMAGRTHGMHAEPTSFGVKLAGFLAELGRHRERLEHAMEQAAVGKLSGAVGTYTTLPPEVESDVCRALKLTPETLATQVVPRDRIAEVLVVLSLLAGFWERLAVELRHLQRTEVGEAIENFTPGQKGSSAMPHKKNPISAENISGLARLVRGYSAVALENMALWHERDISHSSVERVILPDAFIVCDYALARLNDVLSDLYIDKERMRANMGLSQGQLFSSQILLLMVKNGLSREDAYKIVQEISHTLKSRQDFIEALIERVSRDPLLKKKIRPADLRATVKEANFKARFEMLTGRVLKRAMKRSNQRKARK